ncbi:MAG: hypothetical protein J6W13_12810 [Salinivirgaceae bacterium]|nr:hypothetical protein [Salinivirgaceae bacterium]
MLYENIREESLKLKVAADWFPKFDCTDIIGRIDFAVKIRRTDNAIDFGDEYLLWAEAKQQPTDIYRMLAQLIITIKADAADRVPPKFIGCFDNEKIAFVEYHNVLPIHQINDFNWTQTPSAVDDKTIETVRNTISTEKVFSFNFETDSMELRNFLKANFNLDAATNLLSTLIDKNNFIFVYQKWLKQVMPKINVDWAVLKKNYGIYDRDFFLAELNIDDNGTAEVYDDETVNENFYVTFNSADSKPYELIRKDGFGLDASYKFGFKSDGLQQYTEFWKRYKRPPENEYWKYILERIDLLVPQDVRERKGAFFTPQIWVEKSQQYLADVLGANWQDEYYVWDCCAGTGNLLNGLNNKYNVWASTLDQQDVDVMHERIRNGANLLDSHVFQFDFLNDDFSKCPQGLQEIINNPKKRRKLVIYINPPYAEAASRITVTSSGQNKTDVAVLHKTYSKYLNMIGIAGRELFAQFFIRIYCEIPDCILAQFSTLKILQAPNFEGFRYSFKAKLEKSFLVPANTFDNVNGKFPIGFFVWNCAEKEIFKETFTDVFNEKGVFLKTRKIELESDKKSINDWIITTRNRSGERNIGYMSAKGADFQNQNYNFIINDKSQLPHPRGTWVTDRNIVEIGVYLAVRHVITADWLNDRDQFLFPNDGWKTDNVFQTNCLIYTLFYGQNKISSTQGTNHWIPFTESEVDAKERFESHFMSDFLAGKIKSEQPKDLFSDIASAETRRATSLQFTPESQAVMVAGRELWRYYHTMEDANPNASLYDIKEYFQGRDGNGKMKTKSDDKHYTELLDNLKAAMQALAEQIRPKVYEYGFLK